MISFIKKIFRTTSRVRIVSLLFILMLTNANVAWADGPAKSSMTNPLIIMMVAFMIVLLIIIGLLANMIVGTAKLKLQKWKDEKKSATVIHAATAIAGFLLLGNAVFAQAPGGTATPVAASSTDMAAGISSTVFYIMSSVICLELIIILALLISVRNLLKAEKERVMVQAQVQPQAAIAKKAGVSWWDKFNKFRPVEQETDIDLGHDYDGIRELDNRLPPWWLWGFYLTIIFAAIYLYRYHVAHSAPLSAEEYAIAVAKGDEEVQAYLKLKGESVDENTVTMLGKDDIEAGHRLFETSCIACHLEGGAGNVGPNLTDDYWLHGGDIKSIFKTIKYGINAMPTWQNTYSNKQIAQLASYVKSLHGTHPANGLKPQGEFYKENAATPADSTGMKKDSTLKTVK